MFVGASLCVVGGYSQGKVYVFQVPIDILNIASIIHLKAAKVLLL